MPRPPSRAQAAWFDDWLGPHGTLDRVPPGHEAAVALLHPGTRAARDERFPPYRGPRRGELGAEQKRLLTHLLIAVSGTRSPATSASWEPAPDVWPQPPLDLGLLVRSELDFVLVGGRLGSLVWSTWEPRLRQSQPVSALWPDDHAWCVWSDPRLAYSVLAGSAALCDRAREATSLGVADLRPTRR
ncbi:hypothetical protein GCM10009737_04780 [Nocardioides lentus]|uniref:Uncharacterized protein n=1 Tax=Nocardioides lentus TaxID=338077 RepID=A0ABP5ABD9_9ACTN